MIMCCFLYFSCDQRSTAQGLHTPFCTSIYCLVTLSVTNRHQTDRCYWNVLYMFKNSIESFLFWELFLLNISPLYMIDAVVFCALIFPKWIHIQVKGEGDPETRWVDCQKDTCQVSWLARRESRSSSSLGTSVLCPSVPGNRRTCPTTQWYHNTCWEISLSVFWRICSLRNIYYSSQTNISVLLSRL